MNCSEAKLKLEPCASGTLAPEDKIALEEHLATCEGCRLELELTRAVLGSPAFDGVGEETSSGFESTPPTEAAPSAPASGPPPPSMDTDEEVSFADLSLDEGSSKAAAEAGAVPASGSHGSASKTPGGGSKGAEGGGDNLWDFEPVDAHRDVGPPEVSLSFANEALTRKKEDDLKRKATLMRLALWGGGVCGGVLLLGISVWIALAFRQGEPPQPIEGSSVAPPTDAVPPVDFPAPATTDSSSLAPGVSGASSVVPPAVDPGPAASPATASSATAPSAPTTAPPPAGGPAGGDVPALTVQTPVNPQPSAAKPKPKTPPKAAVKPPPKPAPRDVDPDPIPEWSASDLQPPPSTTRPSDKPAPPPSPAPEQEEFSAPPSVTPAPPAGNPAGAEPAAPTSAPPAAVPTPSPAPAAPSGGSVEPAPTPQNTGVTRPIDRLQIATETAAKNEDLVTLRKLKDTWKALLHNVAGPDRSRAKRGQADCLWAIQELSGRVNDRKEALAAYRDYVLTAPAGGTDSRSISRMHYLEEILSEQK